MFRRFVITVSVWICFTSACFAQTLTFPALTGRVVDEAGVLSPADRAALTVSLASLEAATTDQLVIVTLKSLQGRAIEDYGYQLGRHWQIGQKDRDSGVLLIVAVNERKVRIEVGYGLEGTLTDAETKLIIENLILPRFKAGDFPGGIKAGTAAIIQALGGDATGTLSGSARAYPPGGGGAETNQVIWPGIVFGLTGAGLLIFCAMTPGGGVCRLILQILFLMALSGRGGTGAPRDKSRFSGGGGSFGGGGSSGGW